MAMLRLLSAFSKQLRPTPVDLVERKAGELALLSDGKLLPNEAPAIPASGATGGVGLRPDDELELEFDAGLGDDGDNGFDSKVLADLTGLLDDEDRSKAPNSMVSEGDLEYPWNRGVEKLAAHQYHHTGESRSYGCVRRIRAQVSPAPAERDPQPGSGIDHRPDCAEV